MLALFWGCLLVGVLFALVSVLLGDIISGALDGILDFLSVDFLQPMVLATAITSFGGAGILMLKYSTWSSAIVLLLSVLIAVVLSVVIFFGYVRPMQQSENSIAYSMQDLQGKIGEVLVPIPAQGHGEVLVRLGAGNTNQIAASFDAEDIVQGAQVVVVDVREGVVFVTPIAI